MVVPANDARLPVPSAEVIARLRASDKGLPPLRERVRNILQEWIICGELHPASRIYEQELAAVLDVSRVPVREAIRLLEADGFLVVANRKVIVRPLDVETVANVFDVWEALDVLSARLAAERITPAGVRVLARLIEDGKLALDAGDTEAIDRVNPALHEEISHLAGNEILVDILNPVRGRVQCLMWNSQEHPRIWREHAAIVEAIAAGDPDRAQEVARIHIQASRREIMAALERADQTDP